MSKPRTTLTKGRFISACECPSKLYYKCHPEQYLDTGVDNDFMKALAEGGFQVGELAKLDYPAAIDHSDLKPEESWLALQQQIAAANPGQRLVFFEPTIITGRCLIRADILEFQDGAFWLHEVKSKSTRQSRDSDFEGEEEDPSLGVMTQQLDAEGRPWIRSTWKPYVLDVTFQAYVIERAFTREGRVPQVRADLILANKDAVASHDGINQFFRLVFDRTTGRTRAQTRPGTTRASIGDALVIAMPIDEARQHVLRHEKFSGGRTFTQFVAWLEELIESDTQAPPQLSSACRSCEFRALQLELDHSGLKSGFNQCWLQASNLTQQQIDSERLILEVWKWKRTERDARLARGIYLIRDLDPEEVRSGSKPKEDGSLSESDRRVLQVQQVRSDDPIPYLNVDGLRGELAQVRWPIHLIDFETARVAIPFHRGQSPYGQIAFQFSHHLMFPDGRIEHEAQFLQTSPGVFPNFEFVRALKQTLGDDGGSVFMFSHHERTVLNDIYRQLEASGEPDRRELMQWIRTLARPGGSKSKADRPEDPPAPRELIDLRKWVLGWWLHPATRGSNSIKAILPVVFAEGGRFEALYSLPIYGALGGVRSLNFKDKQWIHRHPVTGQVKDPYKTLPPLFEPNDPFIPAAEQRLFQFDEIAQGGAAMQAYARLQFTEMLPVERHAMEQALLRYCELDTFAMGILIEYFRERVGD